jgi:hypothetical protein
MTVIARWPTHRNSIQASGAAVLFDARYLLPQQVILIILQWQFFEIWSGPRLRDFRGNELY